jgi:hypothetical protein
MLPSTDHNWYQYSYNFDSQVTRRREFTTTDANEEAAYNNLLMMNDFRRGPVDQNGNITSPFYEVFWQYTSPISLDHSGNWRKYLDIPSSPTPVVQTFNKSNEITSRDDGFGADTTFATYDANGNTLTAWNLRYIYDAWNRLVEVKGFKPSYTTSLIRFDYNGLHRKVSAGVGSSANLYYYDINDRILTTWQSGSVKHTLVWGNRYGPSQKICRMLD